MAFIWYDFRMIAKFTRRVEKVASGLTPGAHTLHCELLEHTLDPLGQTEFRIFAVMHD